MGNGVSDEAVMRATGRDWSDWQKTLEETEGRTIWTHRELAVFLRTRFEIPYWWCQMVAVEYEKRLGRRTNAPRTHARFEVGVSKTVSFSAHEGWRRVLSTSGLETWLGRGTALIPRPGECFRTQDGAIGEVRVYRPESHLRLTWQPEDWEEPSTLEVRVKPKGDQRCVLSFHHEKLPDAETRESMRAHWKGVLAKLSDGL